jgi:two-component system, NtrC family, sensor kinase
VPGSSSRRTLRGAKWYLTGIILTLGAIPTAYTFGAFIATGCVVTAAVSCFITWVLLEALHRAEAHRYRLEAQLFKSRRLTSLDDLSAGIAHEINNPLGIIAQEVEWMRVLLASDNQRNCPEVEEYGDSLREIASQVDRCKLIVQKLVNLAREMEPVIQRVELNDLVDSMTGIVLREVRSKKEIEITKDFARNLPEIQTDPPLLRQVILNLLINAVHAIEHRGEITISTEAVDDFIEIAVKDDGCGIPPENLHKIFTPFYSTKQGKGTGLGLAMSRGIIERLGGFLSVDSELGEYTMFTIHLPIRGPGEGDKGHGT